MCVLSGMSFANPAEKMTYTIGTQSISYKPHYDFSSPEIDSFAEEILQLFADEQNIQFIFVPFPIKRLNIANNVDFIYPDNPRWRDAQNHQSQLSFSKPLIHILGCTMVLARRQHMQLNELKTVAVPRGFTPDHLLKAQAESYFELVETSNAESALKMVLKGRVDAADVEMNVANFVLRQLNQPNALVPGTELPASRVGFHLSSARHAELLLAFNRFLKNNHAQIEDFKLKYQLKETLTGPVCGLPVNVDP